jgi:hypothetical protein
VTLSTRHVPTHRLLIASNGLGASRRGKVDRFHSRDVERCQNRVDVLP